MSLLVETAELTYQADQEVEHALALTNILGADRSAKQCKYRYPYTTVQEFVLFCQLREVPGAPVIPEG